MEHWKLGAEKVLCTMVGLGDALSQQTARWTQRGEEKRKFHRQHTQTQKTVACLNAYLDKPEADEQLQAIFALLNDHARETLRRALDASTPQGE